MLTLQLASQIVAGLGLLGVMIGAWITAKAVILKPEEAVDIGVPRFASEKFEENLKMPMVRNLLNSSESARRGLLWILGGFALQVVSVALNLIGMI